MRHGVAMRDKLECNLVRGAWVILDEQNMGHRASSRARAGASTE
jgi:hypothetical protein